MSSKLETFLKTNKIDRRQLLIASRQLEGLQPEDRAIRLAKRQGAKAEDKDKKAKETRKPRSGRPVTTVAMDKIFAGKWVTGPMKTRVLRAVNAILERTKKDKVDLAALFDLTSGPPKKKVVKKVDTRRKK
jgi:hypothetical protein